MARILAVDDEDKILFLISECLKTEGHTVDTCAHAAQAAKDLSKGQYDIIFTDLRMPEMDGFEFIRKIREKDSSVIVIVMTGYATIDNAINAIKQGADEYLPKPIKPFEIRRVVTRLLSERSLRMENKELKKELSTKYSFNQFITESQQIKEIFSKLTHIIDEDTTILLTGASGTGKDLLSRLIHFNSQRREKPFITFNLAARPENLVEAELFGYMKGAFTGAVKDTPGAIANASGGTLFLDEIGELKPELQVKILQFVQYKTYTPVGGKEQKADVRLITATNKDLDEMVSDGRFRDDLYYRLNVVHFHLPPLSERNKDIYLIAHHFLTEFNNQYHRNIRLSPECYDRLCTYSWPGNIRELKHYIERLVLFAESDTVTCISFEEEGHVQHNGGIDEDWPELSELNERYIHKVLRHCAGNKQKAAKLLGIDPSTLWRKLKK